MDPLTTPGSILGEGVTRSVEPQDLAISAKMHSVGSAQRAGAAREVRFRRHSLTNHCGGNIFTRFHHHTCQLVARYVRQLHVSHSTPTPHDRGVPFVDLHIRRANRGSMNPHAHLARPDGRLRDPLNLEARSWLRLYQGLHRHLISSSTPNSAFPLASAITCLGAFIGLLPDNGSGSAPPGIGKPRNKRFPWPPESEIRQFPRWVLWRWEVRDGKRTKPPYQVPGGKAKSNDSEPRSMRAHEARSNGRPQALSLDLHPHLPPLPTGHVGEGQSPPPGRFVQRQWQLKLGAAVRVGLQHTA